MVWLRSYAVDSGQAFSFIKVTGQTIGDSDRTIIVFFTRLACWSNVLIQTKFYRLGESGVLSLNVVTTAYMDTLIGPLIQQVFGHYKVNTQQNYHIYSEQGLWSTSCLNMLWWHCYTFCMGWYSVYPRHPKLKACLWGAISYCPIKAMKNKSLNKKNKLYAIPLLESGFWHQRPKDAGALHINNIERPRVKALPHHIWTHFIDKIRSKSAIMFISYLN